MNTKNRILELLEQQLTYNLWRLLSILMKRCLSVRNKLSAEIVNRILGFETPPGETEIFEKYKKRLMMLREGKK